LPAADDEAEYTLAQRGIIQRLSLEPYFVACMAFNITEIGRQYDCRVEVSRYRLMESYTFWQADIDRTLAEGMPRATRDLDHYKYAAFLCFWLRRRVPINKYMLIRSLGDADAGAVSPKQAWFLMHGNEISAFLIALRLVAFHHALALLGSGTAGPVPLASSLDGLDIDERLKTDVAVQLKHKEVSPHGLYLMFRSLFSSPRPQRLPA
jgi:hypothetical protein